MGKRSFRKVSISVSLLVLFLVLPYATVLLVHNVTLTNTIASLDAGFFGEESFRLLVEDENVTAPEVISSVEHDMGNHVMLYSRYRTADNITGVFFHKNCINVPILEGRYFTPKDFLNDANKAVVGKNYRHEMYERNGQTYIRYSGGELEVIGIAGMERESPLDNQIYINANSDWSKQQTSMFYTFDCFNSQDDYATSVEQTVSSRLQCHAEVLSVTKALTSRIVPKLAAGHWFIAILLLTTFCIGLISVEWKNTFLQTFLIKRLVGFTATDLLLELLKAYALPGLACSLVSGGILLVRYPEYMKYTGLALVLMFIYIVAMLWAFMHMIQSENLQEAVQ